LIKPNLQKKSAQGRTKTEKLQMLQEKTPIAFNKMIAQNIYLMGFRSKKMALISKPGQFLMIHLAGTQMDPLLARPFSIHSIKNNNILVILYKTVGKGTSLLSLLKEGDAISVIGPLGNGFPLPGKNQIPLLVAGGMGIAPLFFLSQLLINMKKYELKMFLGFSTSEEIVLFNELKSLGLDLSIATNDGSYGKKGLVTDMLDQYLEKNSRIKPTIYACGPVNMLKKVSLRAISLNLTCYVSLESHMACGLGLCQGCAIKANNTSDKPYYYVCQDGPIFLAEMIDWGSL
jgi:dihydroorotate dehydrogenase electron transfer subunit